MSNNVFNLVHVFHFVVFSMYAESRGRIMNCQAVHVLLPPPKKPNDGNKGAVFILGWADFKMDLTGGIF